MEGLKCTEWWCVLSGVYTTLVKTRGYTNIWVFKGLLQPLSELSVFCSKLVCEILFQEWCRVWKWQKCAFVTWAVMALSRSFLAKPSLARWFLGGNGSKTNPLCSYTILQCKEHVWLPHCWHLPSVSSPSAECNLQWAGECLMAFVELHLLYPPRLKQILSSSELPLCWFYFWGDPCLSHTQFLWDFWDLIWK